MVIEKIETRQEERQLLSFAQERLWFIEKYEEGTNVYNIPMIFKLSKDLDLKVLEKKFKKYSITS